MSLLYPALFSAALEDVPDHERSQAVGTFSLFFDLSQGIGAPLLGVVVALSGERAAFLVAALIAGAGFWAQHRLRRAHAAAGAWRPLPSPRDLGAAPVPTARERDTTDPVASPGADRRVVADVADALPLATLVHALRASLDLRLGDAEARRRGR